MEVISGLIVEKVVMIFSAVSGFWIVKTDVIFEADGCILLIPPILEVSYGLSAGSIRREENVINIAKPCIHKVQELVKCYFQLSSVEDMLLKTCFLLFMKQGLTNSVYSVPQANLFQFGIILCQFILVYTKNSKVYAFM